MAEQCGLLHTVEKEAQEQQRKKQEKAERKAARQLAASGEVRKKRKGLRLRKGVRVKVCYATVGLLTTVVFGWVVPHPGRRGSCCIGLPCILRQHASCQCWPTGVSTDWHTSC